LGKGTGAGTGTGVHTSTSEKRLDERWAMHGKWSDRDTDTYIWLYMHGAEEPRARQTGKKERR
jgi:hypothetical protein